MSNLINTAFSESGNACETVTTFPAVPFARRSPPRNDSPRGSPRGPSRKRPLVAGLPVKGIRITSKLNDPARCRWRDCLPTCELIDTRKRERQYIVDYLAMAESSGGAVSLWIRLLF